MRRHRLMYALSALTLILFAICLVSFFHSFRFDVSRDRGNTRIESWLYDGLVGVEATHGSMGLIGPDESPSWFYWERHFSDNGYAFTLQFSVVLITVVCGILPAWFWSGRLISRFKRRDGHCHCGYCLTGNTSGVCPECG